MMRFGSVYFVVAMAAVALADMNVERTTVSVSQAMRLVDEVLLCSEQGTEGCRTLLERATETIRTVGDDVSAVAASKPNDDDIAIVNATVTKAAAYFKGVNFPCEDPHCKIRAHCVSSMLTASRVVLSSMSSDDGNAEYDCTKCSESLQKLFHTKRGLKPSTRSMKDLWGLMSEASSQASDIVDLYCNQNPTECLVNLQLIATAVNADIAEIEKSNEACVNIADPDCATHVGNADELLIALQPTVTNAESACAANVTSTTCYQDVASIHSLVNKALIPMTEAVSHCKASGEADTCKSKLTTLGYQFSNMSAILTSADSDCNIS